MRDAGGPEVGRISVRVVPSFKGFRRDTKARLEAEEKALNADVDVKPDMAGFRETVKAAASGMEAEVNVKANTSRAAKSLDQFAKRSLSELSTQFKKLESKIELTPDGERMRRNTEAAIRRLEKAIKAEIPLDLELAAGQRSKVASEIAAIKRIADRDPIRVQVDFERTYKILKAGAKARKKLLDKEIADEKRVAKQIADLHARINLNRHKARIDGWKDELQVMKQNTDEVKNFIREYNKAQLRLMTGWATKGQKPQFEIDRGFLGRVNDRLGKLKPRPKIEIDLEPRLGKRFAKSLTDGASMGTGFLKQLRKITPDFGTGINPAGYMLILGMIPPVLSTIAGLAVTLPGMLAGAVAPLGAIALGFKGIGKALENSGLASLDEDGELKIGPKLEKLMDSVGGAFEKGFTPIFNNVVDNLFPIFEKSMPVIAEGLASWTQGFTNVLTSGEGMGQLESIITNIGEAFKRSTPGIESFTTGFMRLADATVQKFPGLADRFNNWGDSFVGWVDKQLEIDPSTGVSKFDSAMSTLRETLSEVNGLIGDIFSWSWDNLADQGFGDKIKEWAGELRRLITETFPAMEVSFRALTETLGPIADALSAINDAGRWLGKIFKAFDSGGEGDKPFLEQSIGQQIGGGLGHNFQQQLKAALGDPEAKKYLDEFYGVAEDKAGEAGAKSGEKLREGMEGVFGGGGSFDLPADSIASGEIREQMIGQVSEAMQGSLDEIQKLAPKLQGALDTAMEPLSSVGEDIFNAIERSSLMVTAGFASLLPAAAAGADDIVNTIREKFNQIPTALVEGFQPASADITQSISQLVSEAETGLAGISSASKPVWSGMKDDAISAMDDIASTAAGLPQRIETALAPLEQVGRNAGLALVQGIAGAIEADTSAESAARGLASRIEAAAKNELGIRSPSRVFQQIGEDTTAGLEKGLAIGFEPVLQRAKDMANTITEAMKDGIEPASFLGGSKVPELKKMLDTIDEQRKQLKVEANNAPDKNQKKVLQDQMKELQVQRDLLSLQKEKIDNERKYGEEVENVYGSILQDAFGMPFDFARTSGEAFLDDLNIGGGALTSVGSQLWDWGVDQGKKYIFNVMNMDEALSAQRTLVNREALQFDRR